MFYICFSTYLYTALIFLLKISHKTMFFNQMTPVFIQFWEFLGYCSVSYCLCPLSLLIPPGTPIWHALDILISYSLVFFKLIFTFYFFIFCSAICLISSVYQTHLPISLFSFYKPLVEFLISVTTFFHVQNIYV